MISSYSEVRLGGMYYLRSVRMDTTFGNVLLLILYTAAKVAGGCSGSCSCPPSPSSCPLGVSLVLDECGCCKVCAQQLNQECSPEKPCDHIKGLRCHLGAGGDPQRGLCQAEAQGRPCEFSGRVFQHGEDFQLSCEHQCSCMDGVVGCMPLCPLHLPLPTWHCTNPRLHTPPGQCCPQWMCDDDNRISEDPHDSPPSPPHTNHISQQLEVPSSHQALGETLQVPFPSSECFPQTTEWTQCSASCGFGISSRVTNSNPQCKLIRETRLCQIRECDITPATRKGKKCRRIVRPREPEQITFAGCSSVRRFRLRTCGSCVDGRCCRPSETRTVHLSFHCTDGESFTRNVMTIQRCRCRKSYCTADRDSSAPSVSLHNDIHTFSP